MFFAHLQFPSGIGAHLHVSWIDPRKTRLMTIVGDQKMAIYNDVSVDQKLWIVDAGVARNDDFGEYVSLGDFQWRTRAGDILIPKIDMTEPLRNEMEAFGQACLTGVPPLTDARHGAEVVAVLEAIDASARASRRAGGARVVIDAAIVAADAELDDTSEVGPFCVIGVDPPDLHPVRMGLAPRSARTRSCTAAPRSAPASTPATACSSASTPSSATTSRSVATPSSSTTCASHDGVRLHTRLLRARVLGARATAPGSGPGYS